MDFRPSDMQQMVRETARKIAQQILAPRARERDREKIFPAAELRALAEAGLMSINVPEEHGGAGAGAVAYALAMMEIAAACASTSVAMAVNNMVAETLVRFGTPEQIARHVTRIASGEYTAASFALSEAHCGSDAAALLTKAELRGGGWILNGSKLWITSGTHAGVFVVWARTGGDGAKGITTFLVEKDAPGLHVGKAEDKMGLRGSTTVALTFEDTPGVVLGEVGGGFKIAMSALDGGRIGIGAQSVGIGRACLAASVAYARERKAFGQPIAEFQAVQWMLADMRTEIDAAELMVLRAAALKEARKPFSREAAMAKVFASEAVQRAASRAVQIHGGYGYVDEFPVERYLRDARVTTIYEGTSEVQRMVIARDLLRD